MNHQTVDLSVSGSSGSVVISPAGRLLLTQRAHQRSADLDADLDGADPVRAVERVASDVGSTALVDLGHGLDGAVLVVRGDAAVTLTGTSAVTFIRPLPGRTVRHVVAPDVTTMILELGGAAPARVEPVGGSWNRSASPADRVVVTSVTPPASIERDPPVALIDLDGPVDDRSGPLPSGDPPAPGGEVVQVLGVRCPADHHNHPDARYCSSCGLRMGVNATAVLVAGPRPPVGLLLTDDGTAVPIAGDLLLGREPDTHPEVIGGRRRGVALADETSVLSRHHIAITVDGWDVSVTDLGSNNGTSVVVAATGLEHRLDPDHPLFLASGDRVDLGPVVLRLSLHHVDGSA